MAHIYKPQKKPRSSSFPILNEIVIERLSDDGRGVAKMPVTGGKTAQNTGKTVFVEGALPGEVVNARLVNQSARYNEAYVTDIIVPSPRRIDPVCQHFSRCGGCHLQHMMIEDQHSFKQQTIVEQLMKWASIEPGAIIPTLSTDQYHYRRRVRLGVSSENRSKNKSILGFRQKRSHQLINISECPVMVEAMEGIIGPLQAWLNQHAASVKHIELVDADQVIAVIIRHNRPLSASVRLGLQEKLVSLDAMCWFQGEKQGELQTAEGEIATPNLHYYLDAPRAEKPLSLDFHPKDFIQANAKVNQLMVNQAIELLSPQPHEQILDLFCGVGNFSLPLSRMAKGVTGIEGVQAMVATATRNAKTNHCNNARFLQANLFDWDELVDSGALSLSYDALILDPPRAGAKTLCANMNKLMPQRIVYVSCDSATFARDAQLLCKNHYTLAQLGVVDMFPQTSHSEIIGLFTQSPSQ